MGRWLLAFNVERLNWIIYYTISARIYFLSKPNFVSFTYIHNDGKFVIFFFIKKTLDLWLIHKVFWLAKSSTLVLKMTIIDSFFIFLTHFSNVTQQQLTPHWSTSKSNFHRSLNFNMLTRTRFLPAVCLCSSVLMTSSLFIKPRGTSSRYCCTSQSH